MSALRSFSIVIKTWNLKDLGALFAKKGDGKMHKTSLHIYVSFWFFSDVNLFWKINKKPHFECLSLKDPVWKMMRQEEKSFTWKSVHLLLEKLFIYMAFLDVWPYRLSRGWQIECLVFSSSLHRSHHPLYPKRVPLRWEENCLLAAEVMNFFLFYFH